MNEEEHKYTTPGMGTSTTGNPRNDHSNNCNKSMSAHANTIAEFLDYKKSGTMIGRSKIITLQGKPEAMTALLDGIESCERSIAAQLDNIETYSAWPQYQEECRYRITQLKAEITVKAVAYKQLLIEVAIWKQQNK